MVPFVTGRKLARDAIRPTKLFYKGFQSVNHALLVVTARSQDYNLVIHIDVLQAISALKVQLKMKFKCVDIIEKEVDMK